MEVIINSKLLLAAAIGKKSIVFSRVPATLI